MKMKRIAAFICLCVLSVCVPGFVFPVTAFAEDGWTAGFAAVPVAYPENADLYIAGYHTGRTGDPSLNDLARASCAYLEAGDRKVFIISVDAVALSRQTVEEIRARIAKKPGLSGITVHVCATHCHAGPDTLGLWGPVGMDGKNKVYMENLMNACADAAAQAYAGRTAGQLYYGKTKTEGIQRDSRLPAVYDPLLYQLRFAPGDGTAGGRLIIYAAHAESMRVANTLLSRDFPGVMADAVERETGDTVLFMSGAAGGQIMTEEMTDAGADPVKNRDMTGEALAELALSVADETPLPPVFSLAGIEMTVPMDNPLFMMYKYLGILGARTVKAKSDTGYGVVTTVGLMRMGDIAVAFLPGEPFPELITGETLTGDDPEPLADIAREAGIEELLVVTLCDDEIGYIVPPSRFRVDEKLPFIVTTEDETGENHYEETNSVGSQAAVCLAEAFRTLVGR